MFKKITVLCLCVFMLCGAFTGCSKPAEDTQPTQNTSIAASSSLAFYIKDGELMMIDTVSGDKTQLTQHVNVQGRKITTCQLRVTDDCSRVFFLDGAEDGGAQSELYSYRPHADSQPQKIASDVVLYDISLDGKTVLYAVEDDQTHTATLYQSDLKTSVKVAQDVGTFGFTVKGDRPAYMKRGEQYEDKSGVRNDMRYFIIGDDAHQNMTFEEIVSEFEIPSSSLTRNRYLYSGNYEYTVGSLKVDGAVVDDDPTLCGSGWTPVNTLTDRMLYYAGTTAGASQTPDDIPYSIKLYTKNQKPVEIVSTLAWSPINAEFATNGDVVYTDNYDTASDTCDLMVYQNGERRLLDTGVSSIVSFTETDRVQGDLMRMSQIFR